MRQMIGGLPANEYHRRWREANREKAREVSRRSAAKIRKANPERYRAAQRKYSKAPAGLWRTYRDNAVRRGISFEIDVDLVSDLSSDSCFYCGAAPSPANGIDRVRNTEGYYFGNVVSCCARCNRIKRADSMESFIGHAKLIAARFA